MTILCAIICICYLLANIFTEYIFLSITSNFKFWNMLHKNVYYFKKSLQIPTPFIQKLLIVILFVIKFSTRLVENYTYLIYLYKVDPHGAGYYIFIKLLTNWYSPSEMFYVFWHHVQNWNLPPCISCQMSLFIVNLLFMW